MELRTNWVPIDLSDAYKHKRFHNRSKISQDGPHIFIFNRKGIKFRFWCQRSVCKSESADDVWCRACVCHSWPPPPSSLLLWCYAKAGLMVVPFLAASPHCLLEIYQRGEAIHNQNWWFFGTFPNCFWPPSPLFWQKNQNSERFKSVFSRRSVFSFWLQPDISVMYIFHQDSWSDFPRHHNL